MRYEAVFATDWSEPEDSSYDLIIYTTVKVKEEVAGVKLEECCK
jgi:hypothetical protein